MCGEEILLVAVRCKHCQSDLRVADLPDPAVLYKGQNRQKNRECSNQD